jgi:hypothetical protein
MHQVSLAQHVAPTSRYVNGKSALVPTFCVLQPMSGVRAWTICFMQTVATEFELDCASLVKIAGCAKRWESSGTPQLDPCRLDLSTVWVTWNNMTGDLAIDIAGP